MRTEGTTRRLCDPFESGVPETCMIKETDFIGRSP